MLVLHEDEDDVRQNNSLHRFMIENSATMNVRLALIHTWMERTEHGNICALKVTEPREHSTGNKKYFTRNKTNKWRKMDFSFQTRFNIDSVSVFCLLFFFNLKCK